MNTLPENTDRIIYSIAIEAIAEWIWKGRPLPWRIAVRGDDFSIDTTLV